MPKVIVVKQPRRRPYYQIKIDGQVVYLGTDFDQAAQQAKALLEGFDPGTVRGGWTIHRLARAWLRENQKPFYSQMLKLWTDYHGPAPLGTVKLTILIDLVRRIVNNRLKPNTIRKVYYYLLKALTWAYEKGRFDTLPRKAKLPTPAP